MTRLQITAFVLACATPQLMAAQARYAALSTSPPTPSAHIQTPPPYDISKLAARRDSFAVMVQGRELGSSVYSIARTPTGWSVGENTSIMNGMMLQTTDLRTDGALNPTSLSQAGTVQGQQLITEIVFREGRAKGSSMVASPTGPKTTQVDAALAAGTLDADALQIVLPLIRWSADAKVSLNYFSPGKGSVNSTTFTVRGTTSLTTPLGTFDSWQIEQESAEARVMFFISKEATPRLLKIAPVGQPIEMVLAK